MSLMSAMSLLVFGRPTLRMFGFWWGRLSADRGEGDAACPAKPTPWAGDGFRVASFDLNSNDEPLC